MVDLIIEQPGMKLYDEAYVRELEALKAHEQKAAPAPRRREFKIIPNITEAQWEQLDAEGWQLVMGDFKDKDVHVVLARGKPATPEPEKQVEAAPIVKEKTPETIKPMPPPLPAAMTPAEQYKAASNARIFAAGQSAYEAIMARSRARWAQRNRFLTPLLRGELSHV